MRDVYPEAKGFEFIHAGISVLLQSVKIALFVQGAHIVTDRAQPLKSLFQNSCSSRMILCRLPAFH